MRKSIYKSQNNKTIPILIIIILLLLSIVMPTFIDMIENSNITIGKVLIAVFISLIELLLIVLLIKNIKDKLTYRKMLKTNKKLPGKIEPVTEIVNNKKTYYLQVHFINPVVGVPTEFKSPKLSINPYTSFKSDKCNIYFLNGRVIAEDFELTNNPEESVFKEKEKEN